MHTRNPPPNLRYWFGVRIASERVSRLHLPTNGVTGCLNELAGLTELMYINLAGNNVQGSLAPLASLKQLKHVDLRVNQLQVRWGGGIGRGRLSQGDEEEGEEEGGEVGGEGEAGRS